jgi:hypothetical protein
MSHHFDSPTGREDPRINLCDLFVFAGEGGSTVLIMTVNPDAGLSSPTTLRPDALYEFKIDLDGDAREDLAIRFVVESPEGGPQRVRVPRAAGEPARTGSDGTPLGAGGALGDAALDVVFTLLANRPLAGTVPADPAANARPFPYLAAPTCSPATQSCSGLPRADGARIGHGA